MSTVAKLLDLRTESHVRQQVNLFMKCCGGTALSPLPAALDVHASTCPLSASPHAVVVCAYWLLRSDTCDRRLSAYGSMANGAIFHPMAPSSYCCQAAEGLSWSPSQAGLPASDSGA